MSQVFSGDCVTNLNATSIVTTAETTGVTGNFLNPPFGNAKAVVTVTVSVTAGTGSTTMQLRIRRNPNAENIVVGGPAVYTPVVGNFAITTYQLPDPIPDGRPVQYGVTVQQVGATANGTINFATVSVFLISG